MARDFTVLVGTIGAGLWRSEDGGESWVRPKGSRPRMPWSELQVFDVAAHPRTRRLSTPAPTRASTEAMIEGRVLKGWNPA